MIICTLENPDDYPKKLFFLDGPGGSGKTYLYNTLIRWCYSNEMNVLAHATTGIASDLLLNGMTMHSSFSLPLMLDKNSSITIKKDSIKAKRIKDADLIIID